MEQEKSLSHQVAHYIQELVMSGQLQAGERLPSERQLAQTLGVSRPLVREGIKVLEIVDILEKRKGSGTYVKGKIEAGVFEPLSLAFKLRGGNMQELFSLRCAVEEYAVRDACKKATPQEVEHLWKIQNDMESYTDLVTKSRMDQKLHYEIVKISGNLLMLDLLRSLSFLMDPLFENLFYDSEESRRNEREIYKEHRLILTAIQQGEEQQAADTIRHHLSQLAV